MSAGCQSIDTVPADDGFHAVFWPNEVERLENNNAKAIPVPDAVIGITV
jgi:hypothetical protein